MERLEELNQLIRQKESELKPLEEERRELWRKRDEEIARRIVKAEVGSGDFELDELRFSANYRCECGAGFAYPKNSMDIHGSWRCSDILRGKALKPENGAEISFTPAQNHSHCIVLKVKINHQQKDFLQGLNNNLHICK